MSTISSHVLDTSTGKPGKGIEAILFVSQDNGWKEISKNKTNDDGRISDFGIDAGKGIYKMRFESGKYFSEKNLVRFYPYTEIVFEVEDGQHYHIPLLLSPFGYTTYRGS